MIRKDIMSYKAKHDCPSPEVIKTGYGYAMSFNPQKQEDKWVPSERYKRLIKNMNRLNSNIKYSKYILYPELSKSGRWHYHGMIWVKNPMGFFSNDLPILHANGTLFIVPQEDWEWYAYCTKQRHLMAPYLHSLGMKYKCHSDDVTDYNEQFKNDNVHNWDFYSMPQNIKDLNL